MRIIQESLQQPVCEAYSLELQQLTGHDRLSVLYIVLTTSNEFRLVENSLIMSILW